MEFRTSIITVQGHALMAKLLNNQGTAKFTRVVTSDAIYNDDQLETLTAISNIKQSVLVSNVSVTNASTVTVEAVFVNTELTQGYDVNTIGLFAQDPSGSEILYSVTPASQNAYMPAFNSVTSSGLLCTLITVVSNSAQVDLTIDPSAVLTKTDYDALLKYADHVSLQSENDAIDSVTNLWSDTQKVSGYFDVNGWNVGAPSQKDRSMPELIPTGSHTQITIKISGVKSVNSGTGRVIQYDSAKNVIGGLIVIPGSNPEFQKTNNLDSKAAFISISVPWNEDGVVLASFGSETRNWIPSVEDIALKREVLSQQNYLNALMQPNMLSKRDLNITANTYQLVAPETFDLLAGHRYMLIVNGHIDETAFKANGYIGAFIFGAGWNQSAQQMFSSMEDETVAVLLSPTVDGRYSFQIYFGPQIEGSQNVTGSATINWWWGCEIKDQPGQVVFQKQFEELSGTVTQLKATLEQLQGGTTK